MITIFTALYCEAQPLIKHYHLMKNNDINKFQVFQNDEITVVVTNTGSIAAAVGVSYTCTLFPPKSNDFLVNIGICGAADKYTPAGSIFLCNKIIEETTDKSFYPDVLFRHNFVESDITTLKKVLHNPDGYFDKNKNTRLFDMEAAAIYQAAAYYFQPHQISFLKIVSDYGTKDRLNPSGVTGLIEKNMEDITKWLEALKHIKIMDEPLFNLEEEAYIKNLVLNLKCSVTMEHNLRQKLQYFKLTNGSFIKVIDGLLSDAELPVKSKTEGKMQVEKLSAGLV